MARNLQLDERVWVPSYLVPGGERLSYAIYQTKVVERLLRSVRIQLPTGEASEPISTSKVHRDIAICLVSIGDFSTEDSLIAPLAKSALQYCRLLLPDEHISSVRIRAIGEFAEWWSKNQAAYTHIVFIGHGSPTGITFGVGGERSAEHFQRRLVSENESAKIFISLCCETGRTPFASKFSSLPFCETLIAPFQSVHGATASQFLQAFLGAHLLRAESTTVAFRSANSALPGKESFRLWREGRLVGGRGT
jgi:hypothetical protein